MNNRNLSAPRLARMHECMAAYVERGELPGLVTLVSRRGETYVDAIGTKALGGTEPMERDSIFRIASLTKPVTAIAAMILVEECKLRLDDPVDPWLPELSNRQVLRSIDSAVDDTEPARRPITLRDLLTFRLGIGAVMVFPAQHPIQKAMEAAGIAPSPNFPQLAPEEYMRRIGGLPLIYQPGERWMYHTGSDILGVLIARCTGKSLSDFFRERIFEPLDMKDTAFSVPASKIHRLPSSYRADRGTGNLVIFDEAAGGLFSRPPVFEAGGGGLVSTAGDLHTFARMLLNYGILGNERILPRPSVELMLTDQITPEQKAASPFFPGFWESRGWGFGISVFTRRTDLNAVPGRFGWDGGYGTSWYSDPKEDLTGILLTQRLWDSPAGPKVCADFWTSAYQSIDD